MSCFQKLKSKNHFYQGKKSSLRLFFLCSFNGNCETTLSFCFLALETLLLEQSEQECSQSGKTRSSSIHSKMKLNCMILSCQFDSCLMMKQMCCGWNDLLGGSVSLMIQIGQKYRWNELESSESSPIKTNRTQSTKSVFAGGSGIFWRQASLVTLCLVVSTLMAPTQL